MHRLLFVNIAILFVLFCAVGEAKKPKPEGESPRIFVPGEHPFDEVNIFGEFGRSVRLPNTDDNKIWWERLVRGEVGRDRFLVLCALKDGNWKTLGDIRDYVEFQIRETYGAGKMREMLVLMAGRPFPHTSHFSGSSLGGVGEGWLEKNREAGSGGISSEWRIEPSVYPLLYFLLMSCPKEDRCN